VLRAIFPFVSKVFQPVKQNSNENHRFGNIPDILPAPPGGILEISNKGRKTMRKTILTALFALSLLPAAANAGMSSASIGASVEFRRYEVVKMLDQRFTVAMEEDAKTPYQMTQDEDGRNILLIQ